MTHLLADHDNVGDSVAWCSDDTAWQCSENVDEVDCALCLDTFLDYAQPVQRRRAELTSTQP
jgi:hypothetical protein